MKRKNVKIGQKVKLEVEGIVVGKSSLRKYLHVYVSKLNGACWILPKDVKSVKENIK